LIDDRIIKYISHAPRVAFIGNGGNLAIAQHGASDMTRHLNKHCFAPDSVHLTALGGDSNWHEKWINQYAIFSDCIIGITTRKDSPIIKGLRELGGILPNRVVIAPKKIRGIDTIVVNETTYHEFEIQALSTIYKIIEQCGAKLPSID
jgi:hypothetical protein